MIGHEQTRSRCRLGLVTILALGIGTACFAAERKELCEHADAVYGIAFSPDGKWMASGSYDKTIKLWNLSHRSVVATLQQHQDQVFRVAFSHDGKSLASASGDGTTIIWDLANHKSRDMMAGQGVAVIDVAYSANDRYLAAGGSLVRVWDLKNGEQLWSIPHPQTFFSVAISPDQKTLACGTRNLIRLYRFADGVQVGGLATEGGMVYQLEFSPDGKWLVSAHADGILTLWDVAKNRKHRSVKADASALFAATFSRDGRQLVSGGRERTVRTWSIPGLEMNDEFYGPEETVLCATYSPDGRHIAAGSYIGKIHLWTLDSE